MNCLAKIIEIVNVIEKILNIHIVTQNELPPSMYRTRATISRS